MSAFVSNEERVINAVEAYAKELNKLGESATDEAINQLISSFSSNLGIDEFIKSSVIKKLNKIKPELANKGLGELVDLAEDIGNIFKQEQTVSKKNVSADDVYNAVKNISNAGDAVNLPTKLATKAYKTFVNARKKLVANATAYITNQPAPEKEGIITGFLKKIGVMCPVDIYVYDSSNNELGNIIDGEVNCNSDIIALDINGDLKNIYLLKNEPINIKYVATDWGLLNLTFEDFSNGSPIGRLNYYDIPLNLGDEITSNDVTTSPQSITINSPNEDIGTYEYISANEDAGVTISINAENGSVAGGAKYVKGDYVNLLAVADEGYKFVGWYNGDEFLERASLYEFTAKEDLNLTAKFIKSSTISSPAITVGKAIALNEENVLVSITTDEENAKIYYTIDGTEPTINSSEYTEPFEISGNEATISVKAIVVVDKNISDVAVAEVEFMNKEAISSKYGDVDDNKILTATDSAWVLKKALNADFKLPVEKIKSEYIKYADVDGDNLITATDAAIILKKVRNKDFVFPIEK